MNNDWFLDEFTIEYVKFLQGVLGELEGLMDSSYCDRLQGEYAYWKERIEVSLSESLAHDHGLEWDRKQLYSSEIKLAMRQASETVEEMTPSLSSIVQLHEELDFRAETNSIHTHREAFVLAYCIHSWRMSTDDKATASEIISKAYDEVYPPTNAHDILDAVREWGEKARKELERIIPKTEPIPLWVREALKPMVDNGSIVCAGSYYVVIRSVRDTFFYFSKTLNEEFYRQWVRKADGTKYSYSAFHRNRYPDPDING